MTNPIDEREQIRKLVPKSGDLLALVEEGLIRIRATQDDLFTVLSTFVLANSLWDWVKKEGIQTAASRNCPYHQTVREIANGTKHLHLEKGAHPNLHLKGLSPEDTWEKIEWAELGSHDPMITVYARRSKSEILRWRSAKWILEEVVDWWREGLGLPNKAYCSHH